MNYNKKGFFEDIIYYNIDFQNKSLNLKNDIFDNIGNFLILFSNFLSTHIENLFSDIKLNNNWHTINQFIKE